jgi:hypothetical protein
VDQPISGAAVSESCVYRTSMDEDARFDFRQCGPLGIEALRDGLRAIPETLGPSVVIPIAFGSTPSRGLVVFWIRLKGSDGATNSQVWHQVYERVGEVWKALDGMAGIDWPHERVASPDSPHDLNGNALVWGGSVTGDGLVMYWGWHSSDVVEIALVQEDHDVQRKPADGHFGAWVVGTELPGSFHVEARDSEGSTVGFVESGWPMGS